MERKKAQEELLRRKNLLREMGQIGKVGGWEFNIDTGQQRWTEEVYHLHEVKLDYDPNVKRGIDFYSDASKAVIAEALQRAGDQGEPFDLELELITAKGNLRHVRVVGKPELDRRRVHGFIQDITERKQLHEYQMRSSQLSALGEVAAGVAHEINNPINGVINCAQLLLNRTEEKDESSQILQRIIREGDRIASIVATLLNLSRRDPGELSSFDIADIVVEPLNLKHQLLLNDGINVELNIPDGLPKIHGNCMQLEQVVLNLLTNARHALNKKYPDPSDGKSIAINATSSQDDHAGWVHLSIKDNGCGIPRENLKKIFNPFFTTKEAGVGTGLGLSVSHDILEKHGATISLDTEIDKFTNITMSFPVQPQENYPIYS